METFRIFELPPPEVAGTAHVSEKFVHAHPSLKVVFDMFAFTSFNSQPMPRIWGSMHVQQVEAAPASKSAPAPTQSTSSCWHKVDGVAAPLVIWRTPGLRHAAFAEVQVKCISGDWPRGHAGERVSK
ncbi:unnamed protein product [Ectocarpus sp. 12 AP-2014]